MNKTNTNIEQTQSNNNPTNSGQITFWHVTTDLNASQSFLESGALAIGNGVGGQSDGFFVWNNKERAVEHLTNFLLKGKTGNGLLVGTNVYKSAISYPNWQFDLEQCIPLNTVLVKYKDQIVKIKNLQCNIVNDFGRIGTDFVDFVKPSKFLCDTYGAFSFKVNSSIFTEDFGHIGVRFVALYQAVIDKMCKNVAFKRDYNKILLETAQDINASKLTNLLEPLNIDCSIGHIGQGFKYCGKKPLRINEIIHVNKDENNLITQTCLHTSSVDTTHQICSFLASSNKQKY